MPVDNSLSKIQLSKRQLLVLFLLSACSIALTSCAFVEWKVVGAVPHPSEDFSVPGNDTLLQFAVPSVIPYPLAGKGDITWVVVSRLKLALGKHFTIGSWRDTPPEKGLFCVITVVSTKRPVYANPFLTLSTLTAGIVPYFDFDEKPAYIITYQLFVDGESKKNYVYEMSQKQLVCICAFLVRPWLGESWVTTEPVGQGRSYRLGEPGVLFGSSLAFLHQFGDELALTAELFWRDGHQDGFF